MGKLGNVCNWLFACCRTPLHLACAKGHSEVIQVLLEWKAKLNVGDNDARTPLMKVGHLENVVENIACKMAVILFMRYCFNRVGGAVRSLAEGNISIGEPAQGQLWIDWYFNGLVQEVCNSSVVAMELRLSCINPWIWLCSNTGLSGTQYGQIPITVYTV